jgi:6-methylsalicylate decarboxylase
VLRMLRSVVGLEQVMCGSDYPYFRRDLAVGCIAALRHTEELAATEREAILGANALKLFPRLAGSASLSGTSLRL